MGNRCCASWGKVMNPETFVEDAPVTKHYKDHPKEPRIMQGPEKLRGWSSAKQILFPVILTCYPWMKEMEWSQCILQIHKALLWGKAWGWPGGCHTETRMAGVVTSGSLAKLKKSKSHLYFLNLSWVACTHRFNNIFYVAEKQTWPGLEGGGREKRFPTFLVAFCWYCYFSSLSSLGFEKEGGPGCIHILVGSYCLQKVNQRVLQKWKEVKNSSGDVFKSIEGFKIWFSCIPCMTTPLYYNFIIPQLSFFF